MILPEGFNRDASSLNEVRHSMQQVTAQVRLPFRSKAWRGQTGNWLGAGIGSSIDFQDHRPYLPGDDPRYIDWQAYARSGHYTMKLYREEVSPKVDLMFDFSASMAVSPLKARRSLELFYFAVESGLQAGASLRCWLVQGEKVRPLETEQVINHGWLPSLENGATAAKADDAFPRRPDFERVQWRSGSLRVVITDLLFPGPPEAALRLLASGKGRGIVLAPYDLEEAEPDWGGNIQFVDCETSFQRQQRVEPDVLSRYIQTYRRHFLLWSEQARRYAVALARVPATTNMLEALRGEPLTEGAVELWT